MDIEIIVYYVFGLVISLIIYYLIVRAATGTKKREFQLKLQNTLLIELLKQGGYSDEKMINHFNDLNNDVELNQSENE